MPNYCASCGSPLMNRIAYDQWECFACGHTCGFRPIAGLALPTPFLLPPPAITVPRPILPRPHTGLLLGEWPMFCFIVLLILVRGL